MWLKQDKQDRQTNYGSDYDCFCEIETLVIVLLAIVVTRMVERIWGIGIWTRTKHAVEKVKLDVRTCYDVEYVLFCDGSGGAGVAGSGSGYGGTIKGLAFWGSTRRAVETG